MLCFAEPQPLSAAQALECSNLAVHPTTSFAQTALVVHTFAPKRLQRSTAAVADPLRARNVDQRMTIPWVANLLHARKLVARR